MLYNLERKENRNMFFYILYQLIVANKSNKISILKLLSVMAGHTIKQPPSVNCFQ